MQEETVIDRMWIWLVALVVPMGVWLLQQVIPAPVLVEESFKLFLVWWGGRGLSKDMGWRVALGIGLAFGLGETVLYGLNALSIAQSGFLWWRLVLTVPMHGLTAVVLWWGVSKRKWQALLLSLVVSVLIHLGFNQLVV